MKYLLIDPSQGMTHFLKGNGLPAVDRTFLCEAMTRRGALRTLAASTIAFITLDPFRRSEAAGPLAFLAPVFKAGLGLLVGKLFEGITQKLFANKINAEKVVPSPRPVNFHTQHASPVMLGGPQLQRKSRYEFHFELNGLPRYDRAERVPEHKDLNLHEMKRIANDREIETYGCVLFPCDFRKKPTADSRRAFEKVCKNVYKTDPEKLDLEYTRPFNTGDEQFEAFGVASKRNPEDKDLLISV